MASKDLVQQMVIMLWPKVGRRRAFEWSQLDPTEAMRQDKDVRRSSVGKVGWPTFSQGKHLVLEAIKGLFL
jgi:hypothetical protein